MWTEGLESILTFWDPRYVKDQARSQQHTTCIQSYLLSGSRQHSCICQGSKTNAELPRSAKIAARTIESSSLAAVKAVSEVRLLFGGAFFKQEASTFSQPF